MTLIFMHEHHFSFGMYTGFGNFFFKNILFMYSRINILEKSVIFILGSLLAGQVLIALALELIWYIVLYYVCGRHVYM